MTDHTHIRDSEHAAERPESGGTQMSSAANNTAAQGLREWWTSPPRPGLRLIISPFEYRHLRAWGGVRIASGIILSGLGTATLSFGGRDRKTYGWASLFLAGAAGNLAYGCWEIRIASETGRQSPAR
jgi:hypothetical protein